MTQAESYMYGVYVINKVTGYEVYQIIISIRFGSIFLKSYPLLYLCTVI